MKLSEIIQKLDKTLSNESYVDWEVLSNQFENIGDIWYVEQDRLKVYQVVGHLCTDTHVGYDAYFLDGDFVCMSHQHARKSAKIFKWVEGKETLVRDYLASLIEEEDDSVFEYLSMDEDVGDYHVRHCSEVCHKELIHNGVKYKVTKDSILTKSYETSIELEGVGKVSLEDCVVPFNLYKGD